MNSLLLTIRVSVALFFASLVGSSKWLGGIFKDAWTKALAGRTKLRLLGDVAVFCGAYLGIYAIAYAAFDHSVGAGIIAQLCLAGYGLYEFSDGLWRARQTANKMTDAMTSNLEGVVKLATEQLVLMQQMRTVIEFHVKAGVITGESMKACRIATEARDAVAQAARSSADFIATQPKEKM